MKRLNGQILTNSTCEASMSDLSSLVNEKQMISQSVPFGHISSNHFQQELKEDVLSRSYQKLNGVQQQRWQVLSVFPHEFDSAAAAAIWRMKDKDEASLLLKVFETQQLIIPSSISQDQKRHRYIIDDSARIFASTHLNPKAYEKALFEHAKHYKEVLHEAALLYEQGGQALEEGLALFEEEWANIQAGQFWSADYAPQNQQAAALCRDYQQVGSYMLLVALDSEEWLAWQESAVMANQYLQHPLNEPDSVSDELDEFTPGENSHTKAFELGNQAVAYIENGQFELAIECYNQQLAIIRQLGDDLVEAKILYNLGNAYYFLDEPRLAIDFYQKSYPFIHQQADLHEEISISISLGNAHVELEEWKEAICFYESSLQLLHDNDLNEPHIEVYLLEELGNAYELLGQLPRAIGFYQQQLASAFKLEASESLCRALGYLGNAYNKTGQVKQAINCYKEQLVIEQQAGNFSAQAKILAFLGQTYAELKEYQAAIGYYQQQLSIVRDKEPEQEESALWYLGLAYHKAGQMEEAIECYEQELQIAHQLGKINEKAYTLEYLGLAYHKIGEIKQAIDCHQQQLELAHQLEDWSSKARALEYLGLTYAELDELPKAIQYFEQELTIVSMFDSRQAEARTLAYLANAYDLQGEQLRSIKLYQQALQLNRELEDKLEEANNLWHLSLAFSQQGKTETAINYAKASLAIYEELDAPQANKIREQVNKWEPKGTFGTFISVFNQALRSSLFPA